MGVEPKRYRAWFIEPGVISYEDVGQGLVMVGREALDRMRPSFVGMPVFNFVHKDVEAEEAFDFENVTKETMAVGIIAGVGTNDVPGTDHFGWDYADMLVWDEETQKNIDENGFTVSCAYDTLQSGPPGKHNGIAFDEEVLNGKYVHMAIVDNPRYEGSTVMRNSKGASKTMKKGWFFTKKNAEPTDEEKKAEAERLAKEKKEKENAEGLQAPEGDGAAFCVIDGKKIPLSEVLAAVEAAEGEGGDAEMENAVGDQDEVTSPSGKKYTGAELKAAYQAKMGGTTENAAEGSQTEVETELVKPDAPMVKKNSTKEAPNEHFATIKKNAAQAAAELEMPHPTTKQDRYAVGKARYGSPVAGGK